MSTFDKSFFAKSECLAALNIFDNDSKLFCPPISDGINCWPATHINNLTTIQCPISGRENETITRWCLANSSAITNASITTPDWQDPQYGRCFRDFDMAFETLYLFIDYYGDNSTYLMDWHDFMKILDRTGFSVSITFLLLAVTIFLVFSKLQDTRVKIHINLFSTMILQSLFAVIQNLLYGCKIYFTLLLDEMAYDKEHSTFCKILTTMGYYFELCMFMWLLIEAWYFYCFISLAPYKNFISFEPFLLTGWVFPMVLLAPWLVYHLSFETNFCWVDMDYKVNFIAVPIFIIILINVFLYILNVRIIFIKMRDTIALPKGMSYWRWFKASLMLVPLFGVYEFLYGISPWIDDSIFKLYFLLIIRTVCSFKGALVAVLYCFINNQVKKEIKRAWYNRKLKQEIYKSQLSSQKSILKF